MTRNMKKVLYVTMAMVMTMLNAWAASIDEATARNNVQQFLNSHSGGSGTRNTILPNEASLIYTEASSVFSGQAAYYIYSTDDSFIVVAGDDRVQGVLAYGDGPIDLNNIPCGLQYLLDQYKGEVDYLFVHPELTVMDLYPTMLASSPRQTGDVEPLLTELWNQLEPYYDDCPEYRGERCVTGCACTSLSMVFHYWKYSNLTSAVPGYVTTTLHLSLDALPVTTFDWDHMLDRYVPGEYNDVEAAAVAKLMRYVGQAERMDYAVDGSGATADDILATVKLFGYSRAATLLNKSSFSERQWRDLMCAELRAGRPIVYTGQDSHGGGGHAFNVDGYEAATGLFHINFGWDGYGNAYCALNDFTANGDTYSNSQTMIIGIEPPSELQPELTVSPATLSFSTQTGKTLSKTITVFAKGISGDLTLQLEDANGVYSIDRTSISADEAVGGVTVNVAYNPAVAGVDAASLIISGDGVEAQTVSIMGVAIAQPITVTPGMLSLDAEVGTTQTASFTVTGDHLPGKLSLTLDDADGVFAIDKTSITASEAANGATVTVTYSPAVVGSNAATVTITGIGVETTTVALNGTATTPPVPTGPEITTSVEALDFGEVTFGYNKTMRFRLNGHDLENNVTLSLQGVRYDQFELTPTVISPEEAANGVTVAVTFDPIFSQNYNATLVISCPDVEDIVMPITAVSVNPEATITGNTSRSYSAYVGQISLSSSVEVVRWADAGIYPPITPPVVPMDNGSGDGTMLNVAASTNGGVDNTRYSATIVGDDCFTARISNGSATAKTCHVSISFNPTTCGTFHATLTLSCNGAVPIVVTLSGTATVLKSDPEMKPVNQRDVTSSSFVARWSQECYSEGVESFDIECAPQGSDFDPNDPDYLLLEGLPTKNCIPQGLAAMVGNTHSNYQFNILGLNGGSYMYRVMAHYIDGTDSEWSNVETVSLLLDAPCFIPGDMNGDGELTLDDVDLLIQAVNNGIVELLAKPAADVNGNGNVNLQDIIDLVDLVLYP